MNMCTRVTTSVPLAWLSGGGVTAATPVSDRLSMAYYKGERRNNQKRDFVLPHNTLQENVYCHIIHLLQGTDKVYLLQG